MKFQTKTLNRTEFVVDMWITPYKYVKYGHSILITIVLVPSASFYSILPSQTIYIKYYNSFIRAFPVLILTPVSIYRSNKVIIKELTQKKWNRAPWSDTFNGWPSTWICPIWSPPPQNIHISSKTPYKNLQSIQDAR